jgi:hypothetical protein
MSIQAFKKKGVINYGSKRSGKPPGGRWVSQGPFGGYHFEAPDGAVGFSINGGRRNQGRVGQSMAMSKNGTPFRGQFPCWGSGGIRNTYVKSEPLFNSPLVKAVNRGSQYEFIKPSVLSTDGMLEKKYMWINNGQYPNYWVQPVYPNGTMSDNASQWLYIQNKAAANICVNDTNKPQVYVGHRIRCSPTGCSTTPAKYRSYSTISSNVGYTKTLSIPQTASQYTLQVQQRSLNPVGPQKPFPFAANGGSASASNTRTFGAPPPVSIVSFLTPPPGYWELTAAEKAGLEAKCNSSLKDPVVRAQLLNMIQGGSQ